MARDRKSSTGSSADKSGQEGQRPGLPLVCGCLWICVVLSSLGVVYSTYETRQATRELEDIRRQAATLQVDSGKYLLEKSALAAYTRVEREAQVQLGMEVPSFDSLEMVRR